VKYNKYRASGVRMVLSGRIRKVSGFLVKRLFRPPENIANQLRTLVKGVKLGVGCCLPEDPQLGCGRGIWYQSRDFSGTGFGRGLTVIGQSSDWLFF
jgi:hypothetical protein